MAKRKVAMLRSCLLEDFAWRMDNGVEDFLGLETDLLAECEGDDCLWWRSKTQGM